MVISNQDREIEYLDSQVMRVGRVWMTRYLYTDVLTGEILMFWDDLPVDECEEQAESLAS